MRLALALSFLLLTAFPGFAEDWQPLFNGKDLSGWRANNDPESFAVKDGVLRVQSTGKSAAHLFYVGDLKDGFVKLKSIWYFKDIRLKRLP